MLKIPFRAFKTTVIILTALMEKVGSGARADGRFQQKCGRKKYQMETLKMRNMATEIKDAFDGPTALDDSVTQLGKKSGQ